MSAGEVQPIDYEPKPPASPRVRDDTAYILPMVAFLLFTWLGTNETVADAVPQAYAVSYVVKTVVVVGMLWAFRRSYTRVRWNHAWLGVIVGVVGAVQWVGMQLWLQRYEFFRPPDDPFDPIQAFDEPFVAFAFIAVRLIGAVLLVPVMEELFWRDFLWRQILAPNDFKLAAVGEWGWAPFLGVSAAFALVHGNWWLTSVVWALMIGALLVYTKSLGACIVAHAVTNLLLGVYVLRTGDWAFW
jgi:CAAX prenyl protease-like protein